MRRVAKPVLGAVLLGLLAAPVVPAQSCIGEFAAARVLPTGGVPQGMAAEDLDLDGDVDLAVLGSQDEVEIFLGNGDGTFASPTSFSVGNWGYAIASARLDGDLVPDLVVTDRAQAAIGIYIGDGAGGFQSAVSFATGTSPVHVTVADLDGDAALDVVTTHPDYDAISVLLGNGDGTFQQYKQFAAGMDPLFPVMGEFTGDGAMDLVVLNGGYYYADRIALLRGNGDGTFQPPVLTLVGSGVQAAAAADLDADGALDLAVTLRSNDSVAILLGTGTGAFQAPVVYACGSEPAGVAAPDLDGDGDRDLVISLPQTDEVASLLNAGDGTFGGLTTALVGPEPGAILARDVDRDGDQDALVIDDDPSITIALGRGDGTLIGAARTSVEEDLTKVASADVDGDGLGDALVLGRYSNALWIALGNGDGTFRAGTSYDVGTSYLSNLIAEDLDADGDVDIAMTASDDAVTVLLGAGDGSFSFAPDAPTGNDPGRIVSGLLDPGSAVDLVTMESAGFSVLLGRGDGTFEAPRSYPLATGATDLVQADLDGDGFGDLAMTRSVEVAVFLGNGDGTFLAAVLYPTSPYMAAIAAVDLDGDGDLDLVAGGDPYYSSGTPLNVLVGQGDGTFVNGPTYDVPAAEIERADVTRDGTEDLIVRNGTGIAVLESRGNGTLADPVVHAVGRASLSASVGDLDADGSGDILVGRYRELIAIIGEGITVRPSTLPAGVLGVPYAATLTGYGGTAPYTFSLASGTLPPGLSLDPAGLLSGVPSGAGAFTFMVAMQDGLGCTARHSYTLVIDSSAAFLVGQGLGQPNPNRVRLFGPSGTPGGADFYAYVAGQWGVNVAAAELDGGGRDEILTGPGPGAVFGPQVRGFQRDGTAMGKVNFYAYGTLRYGVNVAGADVDGDGFAEVLTGPGPGEVFGPHVRGFDVDGGALLPIAKINFFSYSTLKNGTNVAGGNVDGDGFTELLTGAGAGPVFGPHVRGFEYDGTAVSAIGKINFLAFTSTGHGVNVAGGDPDDDGFDEIGATPGPGPSHPATYQGFDYDGVAVSEIAAFERTRTGALYGGRIALGDVSEDLVDDLVTGLGRDPSAVSDVVSYRFTGILETLPNDFTPFDGGYGVSVAAGALGP